MRHAFVTYRKKIAYASRQSVITKTHLFKYTENFTTKKGKFSEKKSDIFHISAQNIDCGYSLEPPHQGGSTKNIDCGYSLEPPHRGGSKEYHNLCFEQNQNIDCGYSLEPPHRDDSKEYPQSMFRAKLRKIMHTPVNPTFTI